MLKRVAAIGSSTAVIGALLTGALSTPALAADCSTTLTAIEPTTVVAGVRQVSQPEHVEWIRSANVSGTDAQWAYNYALTGNVDMGGCEWLPGSGGVIGDTTVAFSGDFEGGGFAITGLTIDGGGSDDYLGFFGVTDGATISNLGLEGIAVSGNDRLGGLIGQATDSTIANSWTTGSVTGDDGTGDDDYLGGLIGEANGTTISNSWATGDVDGDGDTAGLVGHLDSSTLTGSWATGNVVGGADGGDDIGGLVGQIDDNESGPDPAVSDSYATGNVTATTPSAAPDRADFVGGLVGDIGPGEVTNSWASGAVRTDGDKAGIKVGGLGGALGSGGSVSGSYATGAVTSTGNDGSDNTFAGGLIGFVDSGSITNSWASGAVNGAEDDNGGLVGALETAGSITGSYARGSVTGGDDYTGGLVGDFDGDAISTSWASGSVNGNDNQVGGLVGRISSGAISVSFSTSAVRSSSGGDYVGGLVGQASTGTAISDAYAIGSVSSAGQYVGGLVGDNRATVVRSYSLGAVSAGADGGGLIGFDAGGSTTSSYWDTESSGLSLSDGGSGKTTVEMRTVTTYEGWSISEGYNPASTWGICGPVNSGYPYLTAFNSSDPCVTPPPSYQFTFRLPDGTECGAIGPVGVVDGTIYILPGEDADCRTMEGALVGGWTIPVPEGYDSIGSPAMPFAPGQKVRVSDSQQFTVVPFEPLLSLTLDSNVMADEACEANEVEFVDEANREEYSWVPRGDISMARLPMVAACQPPGYTLAGWNTASDGSGTMFGPGAGLPSEWATDKTNRYRLFAIWSPA